MREPEVTSRHLRGATELILVVPIKRGFIPVSELLSYSARLHTLLETLFELRRISIERDAKVLKGPVEQLQTISRVQWTVLGPEQQLLVTAHFDRSWEDYFQLLVDLDGSLLDLIFSHCEDFVGFSCADGFDRFAQFIRKHQRPCDFLFASNPELTVDDVRLFSKASIAGGSLSGVTIAPVVQEAASSPTPNQRFAETLIALYDLRKRFFSDATELAESAAGAPTRSGNELFDDAMRALLRPEVIGADLEAIRRFLPADARAWVDLLFSAQDEHDDGERISVTESDLAEIQGNVLQGYENVLEGCIALVRCDDEQTLGQLIGELQPLTRTQADSGKSGPTLNVAITYAGLERLGLSSDQLALFPKEFREGMEARAGLIGDLGPAHPSRWKRPVDAEGREIQLSSVDLVLTIQGTAAPTIEALTKLDLVSRLGFGDPASGRRVLFVQELKRFPDKGRVKEHFGFREDDAVSSQPVADVKVGGLDPRAAAKEEDKRADRDIVRAGELILGYENERGKVAPCADRQINPHSWELFKNGTFLVMRKLQQNVGKLYEYADKVGGREKREEALSRFVGRALDGAPLLKERAKQTKSVRRNDFDFEGDGDVDVTGAIRGAECPMHSHIRLANPRTQLQGRAAMPRIMRRGFSYGPRYDEKDPSDAAERGLMFMAFNASIAGQYEVIQRWLNAGNPTGLLSAHNDMLSSTLPHTPVPRMVRIGDQLEPLSERDKPFVALQWGLYLFVPSKHALGWLAQQAAAAPAQKNAAMQAAVDRGRIKIKQLDQLAVADVDAARREWKSALEERDNFRVASDVWFAIHADGGFKMTPYGALVASAAGAQAVLADRGQHFSVREYWQRLSETTGEHYLAFDPEPAHVVRDVGSAFDDAGYEARLGQGDGQVTYSKLSAAPNAELAEISSQEAFDLALGYAREFLAGLDEKFDVLRDDTRRAVRVSDLAKVVVARISQDWLGLPVAANPERSEDENRLIALEPFILTSRYSFQPRPESWVKTEVVEKVQQAKLRDATLRGRLPDALRGQGVDEEQIAAASLGAVVGFAAPAVGCIVSAIDLWTEEDMLGGLAMLLDSGEGRAKLQAIVLETLVRRPVPSTVYRTATNDARIGNVAIPAGTKVIVSLSAAVLDTRLRNPLDKESWRWLFGGAHGTDPTDGNPPHGCPARHAAISVLFGTVVALFEQKRLRRERRGVLSYDQR